MTPLRCVATGVANLASVRAAFARLGRELVPATRADVAGDGALVLPGVGHFGAAMARLEEQDLVAPLGERVRAGRPTLGICLGMQLCAAASDEAPGVPGLGAVAGVARRFPAEVRCPHMGWNVVREDPGARLLAGGAYYFANSYRLTDAPAGWTAAWATHGAPFVAALERGAVLLCQFHPELSGRAGRELLLRWLCAAEVAPC